MKKIRTAGDVLELAMLGVVYLIVGLMFWPYLLFLLVWGLIGELFLKKHY